MRKRPQGCTKETQHQGGERTDSGSQRGRAGGQQDGLYGIGDPQSDRGAGAGDRHTGEGTGNLRGRGQKAGGEIFLHRAGEKQRG